MEGPALGEAEADERFDARLRRPRPRPPVIVAPWFNRALARNGAYRRSLQHLRDDGVRLVLTERTQPGAPLPDHDEPFPWKDVLAELHKIPLTTPGS